MSHAVQFHGPCSVVRYERQPDGSYLQTDEAEFSGDPMGGGFTDRRARALGRDEAAALVEAGMRGHDLPCPFPSIVARADRPHAAPGDAPKRSDDPLGNALAPRLSDQRDIDLALPSTEYLASAFGALAWAPAIWFCLSLWLSRVHHGAESRYFVESFVYTGLLVVALAVVSVLVKRTRRGPVRVGRVVAALSPLDTAPEDPRVARRRGGALTDLAVWIGGLGMWAGPFLCAWWIRGRTWPGPVGGAEVIDAVDVAVASVGLFVVSALRMTRVIGEAVRTRRALAAARR